MESEFIVIALIVIALLGAVSFTYVCFCPILVALVYRRRLHWCLRTLCIVVVTAIYAATGYGIYRFIGTEHMQALAGLLGLVLIMYAFQFHAGFKIATKLGWMNKAETQSDLDLKWRLYQE